MKLLATLNSRFNVRGKLGCGFQSAITYFFIRSCNHLQRVKMFFQCFFICKKGMYYLEKIKRYQYLVIPITCFKHFTGRVHKNYITNGAALAFGC